MAIEYRDNSTRDKTYRMLIVVFYKGELTMVYKIRLNQLRYIVQSISFVLLILWSNFFFSTNAFAATLHGQVVDKGSHTVIPLVSDSVLHNPGQGWVLYGDPSNQTAGTLAYGSVGYMRYDWSKIEPEEGVYNWSVIDADLNAWHAVGKQFAFGVMNANSSDANIAYVTPQWVFNDGAAAVKSQTDDPILGRSSIQYIPVWNDPIFLRKVQDFVTALAQRYDGNPNIAYIDIRSYGNWGSQEVNGLKNSVALSSVVAQQHDVIYRNAFKHTQLILPWSETYYSSNYTWAVQNNIGLRRDGIMVDSNGSELMGAHNKSPIVFEFYSSYQWLVQKGYWSTSKLVAALNAGKPSYIGMGQWGNDAQVMLAQQPQLVQTVTNMMGYHFVLSSATLPNTISNSSPSSISLAWKNQGVASPGQAGSVAVALLDASNNVVQKQWLVGVNPQTWAAGQSTISTASVTFKGVPAGTYKLAVGLFLHRTDSAPTYQIGNQGLTQNGWYVLSNMPVN
jgi:Domain of unknown function (DUF4832)/Beta-galactosidase